MISRVFMIKYHKHSVNSYTLKSLTRSCLDEFISSPLLNNPRVGNRNRFATNTRLDGKHKFVKYCPPPHEDHDYKNMRLKRPMSPHLTIYGPTEPAMTSIAQRGTGALLAFYAFALGAGSLILPNGVESYVYMFQSLDMGFLKTLLLKIILGAPFCFHYFNGIRFCIWNLAKMFSEKEVKSSARKVFIATAALTFFFAII